MNSDFKYFAFISYSHADERWSRWLHSALETWRVPRRLVGRPTGQGPLPARLTPIFRDRDELTGAPDLGSTVTAALEASRHLIVICSPAAARSRWVDAEVRTFKRMGRGDRILTLIVDGDPPACFVPSLRFELEPDGSLSTREAEPIAADLRPGKDGKTNAKLKLIAGLLGTGFDELKRREQRRQQKRMLLITAASVAGMLITGALAVTAWISRQDAIRNRDQAEDLIGFMLGDFRQQLEPLGKLELLKNVGDKAMAYFSSQSERDITDESLLRRAEALRQIGDVRLSLGEFRPALSAFQESLSLSGTLSQRAPDNQDWLFALGNAWFWVGYTHWQKGDLDAAVSPMTEYLNAAERLVELAPDNSKWQLERGYALANLGSLDFARGDSESAIAHFEASNEIAEKLIAVSPRDVGLLSSRIENYSWLASIDEGRGELRSARELHGKTLRLTSELLAMQPDDRRLWVEEVLRRKLYGNVLLLMGELDGADGVTHEATERMRTLIALDPANAVWQRLLASILEQQARILRASGRCAAALPVADEGLRISVVVNEKAAEMEVGQLTRMALINAKAECLLEAGQIEESRELLDGHLAQTMPIDEKHADPAAYPSHLAMSRYIAGRAWAASGQMELARKEWQAGLALLEISREQPNYRATKALLLHALDRNQEALEMSSRLSAQGYAEPAFQRQLKAAGSLR